jgi:GT2 family glycosyltransferase
VEGGLPRFSIVVPTHNRADVLPLAIRSALWQTAGDFELLIAGDGCTDGTADAVRSFGDPRIRWFDLPKAPGVGYANRNRALRDARGTYVAYLGHDDLWFPDHLERLAARLESADAELVHSRLLAVDDTGRLRPCSYNLEVPAHQATLWRADMAMTMSTVMHTRACLERYGYWSEDLPRMADVEMWHRIVAGGGFRRAAFVPEPTLLHFTSSKPTPARTQAARWITRGILGAAQSQLPSWRIDPGETPQQAAWRYLSDDPARRVREIRDGVVRFQDALLWSARSSLGLAGLRAGLGAGAGLDRIVRGLVRLASPRWRAASSAVQDRTRPLDTRARGRRDATDEPLG